MRRLAAIRTLGLTGVVAAVQAAAQETPTPPAWAYPVNPAPPAAAAPAAANTPAAAAPAPAQTPERLPGTSLTFTRAQITAQEPADWRPETHPPMPAIVARGRQPDVRACALCHYPNGQGRPENGPASGQPAAYIIQQLIDFQNGTRTSSEPRMGPPAAMVRVAKAMTAEEMAISADYFASFSYQPWIRVVETATVPKLRFAGGMFMPAEGTEPIGNRIVEVPEDPASTELRDPISGFVAYVPPGTLARGENLVKTGGGKTTVCAVCHGADLRGLGPVPAIVGRSASYTMRQLFDFKHGARAGAWSPLMKPSVDGLSDDELMAVSAYLAAQKP